MFVATIISYMHKIGQGINGSNTSYMQDSSRTGTSYMHKGFPRRARPFAGGSEEAGGGQRGCCVGGGVFLRAACARYRSVVLPGAFCALMCPRQPSLAQSLCWDSAATPKSGSSVGLVPSLEGDGGAVQHLMIITRAVPGCPGLGTVLGGCLSCEFGGSPRYRIW